MKSFKTMGKINKEFTITFTPEEIGDIVKTHIKTVFGHVTETVSFNIEPTTDDMGNYSGQELSKVVCKGKL